MSELPQVSIAIVSWNTRELLARCLRSIEPEVRAGRAEAWVVDNASNDGSAELVRERFPWARLTASRDNLGFGSAVNLVAEGTAAPWIGIANADIELTPGSLARLLDIGAQMPEVGIVAPRLVLPDGTTQHSVYRFPTILYTLLFNLDVWRLSPTLANWMALEGQWNPERAGLIDWALGAFVLVRREAWTRAGGFDPELWMYAEDLDLGWRVTTAGFKTWYAPAAAVNHHGAASTTQAWGEARIERWQRSTYAWMLRRRGVLSMRACALINTAGASMRTVVLIPPALMLRGIWRERMRVMQFWARLHLKHLIASRSALESHR